SSGSCEVAHDQIPLAVVAERLVVHLGSVVRHTRKLIVPADVQVHKPIVPTRRGVQAGHVRVGGAAVDPRVIATGQNPVAHRKKRLHGSRRMVSEHRHKSAGDGADLSEILYVSSVHRGETPADVSVGAIAVDEGNRVDLTVDFRTPFRQLERPGIAEAKDVLARTRDATVNYPRKRPHRIHRLTALNQLADLLDRVGIFYAEMWRAGDRSGPHPGTRGRHPAPVHRYLGASDRDA